MRAGCDIALNCWARLDDMTEIWRLEKAKLADSTKLKEELEKLNLELADATRRGDYAKAGDLQSGTIPNLEKADTREKLQQLLALDEADFGRTVSGRVTVQPLDGVSSLPSGVRNLEIGASGAWSTVAEGLNSFKGKAGQLVLIPGVHGGLDHVLVGAGEPFDPMSARGLAGRLPARRTRRRRHSILSRLGLIPIIIMASLRWNGWGVPCLRWPRRWPPSCCAPGASPPCPR